MSNNQLTLKMNGKDAANIENGTLRIGSNSERVENKPPTVNGKRKVSSLDVGQSGDPMRKRDRRESAGGGQNNTSPDTSLLSNDAEGDIPLSVIIERVASHALAKLKSIIEK